MTAFADYLTQVDEITSAQEARTGAGIVRAWAHVHDDGDTITIIAGAGIDSITVNQALGAGYYDVTFAADVDLTVCHAAATYLAEETNDFGIIVPNNPESGQVLTLFRWDLNDTGSAERGPFTVALIGK